MESNLAVSAGILFAQYNFLIPDPLCLKSFILCNSSEFLTAKLMLPDS